MLRRFSIGEIRSQFFSAPSEEYREETLRLLRSGDETQEAEGIERHLATRGVLVDSIPTDTVWHLAMLELSREEFDGLRTIVDEGWKRYSGGSFRLDDAAKYLEANLGRDPRVAAVIESYRNGTAELKGITLFGRDLEGPFTIVQGHGRLVAAYLVSVQRSTEAVPKSGLEVVLGVSPTQWGRSDIARC